MPILESKIDHFGLVWIAITYSCNNRCIWCYADSPITTNHLKQINIDQIKSIAHLLKDLEIKKIALIGGEPTLHPDVLRIVQILTDHGLGTHIVTNGWGFSKPSFSAEIKSSGLIHAGFSVEGPDASIHDAITQQPGSFEACLKGIQNALAAGIGTHTNTTICPQNINYLVAIADKLINYGVSAINFNICGPCLSQSHSHAISPTISANAYSNVYKHLKNKGIRTKLLTATPLCNFESDLREELKVKHIVRGGPCQLAHGRGFVIDYNGDAIPCTHMTGYPMFNIFKKTGEVLSPNEFLERYNDPFGLPVQFRQGMRRYASSKCERVNCHEPCAGGCPLFWTQFNPEREIRGKH